MIYNCWSIFSLITLSRLFITWWSSAKNNSQVKGLANWWMSKLSKILTRVIQSRLCNIVYLSYLYGTCDLFHICLYLDKISRVFLCCMRWVWINSSSVNWLVELVALNTGYLWGRPEHLWKIWFTLLISCTQPIMRPTIRLHYISVKLHSEYSWIASNSTN